MVPVATNSSYCNPTIITDMVSLDSSLTQRMQRKDPKLKQTLSEHAFSIINPFDTVLFFAFISFQDKPSFLPNILKIGNLIKLEL